MKTLFVPLRLLLVLTLLTGVAYPLAVMTVGNWCWPLAAGGTLAYQRGEVVGSLLLAQGFTSERYFWPRPAEHQDLGGLQVP